MPTWFEENVPRYMPLQGYQIPWPMFVNDKQPGDRVPGMDSLDKLKGHQVDLYMSGAEYMEKLNAAMDWVISEPNGAICWMHGWYFQLLFQELMVTLQGGTTVPPAVKANDKWEVVHMESVLWMAQGITLVRKLQKMHQAGVDVRILGWLSPIMVQSKPIAELTQGLAVMRDANQVEYLQATGFTSTNVSNLLNLLQLREMGLPKEQVAFNTMSHPLGGAHAKFVVIGTSKEMQTFIGGVDLSPDRNQLQWHDATVLVKGAAAIETALYYKQLWNENASQDAVKVSVDARNFQNSPYLPQTEFLTHHGQKIATDLSAWKVPQLNGQYNQHVQLYRTVPRKHYGGLAPIVVRAAVGAFIADRLGVNTIDAISMVSNLADVPSVYTPALSFAADGIFEFKVACYKAVQAAERFIFIIDQMVSNAELMSVINDRIKVLREKKTMLKVIVLTSLLTAESSIDPQTQQQVDVLKYKALQLQMLSLAAKGIPEDDLKHHFAWGHLSSHAKLMVVDDKWLSVGSANCMRRSFYTDFELGVGVMDETWVRLQRAKVWKGFCLAGVDDANLEDLDIALHLWNPAWADSAKVASKNKNDLPVLNPQMVPIAECDLKSYPSDESYDAMRMIVEDPDSNSAL